VPQQHRLYKNAIIGSVLVCTSLVGRIGAQSPGADFEALQEAMKAINDALKYPSLANPRLPDSAVNKLRFERLHSARTELQSRIAAFTAGTAQGTVDILLKCLTTRVLEAQLDLCQTPDDRVTVYQWAVGIAKVIEDINQTRFKAGRISIYDLEEARFAHLDLQIKLLEAKDQASKQKRK
jgi:hypothetical protein